MNIFITHVTHMRNGRYACVIVLTSLGLVLKAACSSKLDIFLSKKGLMNWYMILIQKKNVAPDSL